MKSSLIFLTFFLTPYVLLGTIGTKEICDISICNYEADCYKTNNKTICECIGYFFEGEFCETPKDNCVSNPCKNGGTCHPYLGHYYCECPEGFSDQTCSSTDDLFKAINIHYNHLAPVSEEQIFLLTVEHPGSMRMFIELITPSNLLEGAIFSPPDDRFVSSKDLLALSRKLGLRHSDSLPYKRGYYRLVYATFYKLGRTVLNLQVKTLPRFGTAFFQTFSILVYDPSREFCLPNVVVRMCSNPQSPLGVDIAIFNFVEPIVRERCDSDSRFKVKWSIRNFADSIKLKTYPEDISTTLILSPYSLWFNYRDEYPRSYLVRGDTYEISRTGRTVSYTVVRCYIQVSVKPVQARIIGGSYREVGIGSRFTIDSSISRDYARHPHKDQKMIFKWKCSTTATPTSYCSEDMGSKSYLKIPPNELSLGQSYKYEVTVRSSIHVKKSHTTIQTIKVVDTPQLLPHFYCLRNCEDSKFTAGQLIHLQLTCIECPSGEPTYSVVDSQGIEVASSQHVILTEESKSEVVLNVTVQVADQSGSSIIKLALNSPPSSGSCTTDPTAGTAYETIFKIICRGYKDDNLPLSYKFYAGPTLIDENAASVLTTNLFPTNNPICELKVRICDNFAACTEVQLEVNLRPLVAKGSWLDFLNQNTSNLQGLINDGDRDSAFTLVQSVMPFIKPTEGLALTEYIVECFGNLPIRRLMAAEHILTVTKNLFQATELSSDSAVTVSRLFTHVTTGLISSISNEEIYDLSLEIHEHMLGEVFASIEKSSKEIEKFPLVHDAEPPPPDDPFKENYPDYGELNMNDVIHMSNWLKSFTSMHKCLQVMGVASAFTQLPEEKPMLVKEKGVTSQTLVIDTTEPVALSWSQSSTVINLPSEFLSSLTGTELAIQISVFETNPFWWCPEQYKMNTEVLSVGAYSRDLSSLKSSSTNVGFEFFMAIKGDENTEQGTSITGNITSSSDVQVYERLLPPHAVLVITFSSLKTVIQVLLLAGKKPKGFMLRDAVTLNPSDDNSTLLLVNPKGTESKGYIAVASDSETSFSFVMVTRLCISWDEREHEWSSKFCSVGNKTNATHIHCSCRHLSMFAGKVYPTFAQVQPAIGLVSDLPFNFHQLYFYLVVIVLLSLLLRSAWSRSQISVHCLVLLHNKPGRNQKHKYVVTIYTNGHELAATSSSVTVQIHGSKNDSDPFTLYPSRRCSFFERLNQTSFLVICPRSLGSLRSLSVYHDSFGRYPSWNCHAIKVRDELNQHEYIFLVNKWLSDVKSATCTIYVPLAKKEHIQMRKQIFKDALADAFANWYVQQSFSSIRLYGSLTALEKTSIFIMRVCLVIVVTMAVFGPTTVMTFEEEREIYYTMLLDFGKLLAMAFWCHVIGVLLGAVVYYTYYKQRHHEGSTQYALVFKE